VLVAVLSLALAGLAWGTTALAQQGGGESIAQGALVDEATGATLRTAAGHLAVSKSREADEDVLGLWAGADGAATPGRYGVAGGGALEYVVSAAARGCNLLAEGRDAMVVLSGSGADEARRMVADAAACPEGGGGAEALVEYGGEPLLARCPADVGGADAQCHLLRAKRGGGNATGAGGGARHRLAAAAAPGAPVHVVAGASALRCAGGTCHVAESGAGRRRRRRRRLSTPTGSESAPLRPSFSSLYCSCHDHGGTCDCTFSYGACFPVGARAALERAATKPTTALAIDGRALPAAAAGARASSDGSVFGRRGAAAAAPFAASAAEGGAVLRLSPDRFAPTAASPAAPWAARASLPACSVTTKHGAWLAGDGEARLERAVDVARRAGAGLFRTRSPARSASPPAARAPLPPPPLSGSASRCPPANRRCVRRCGRCTARSAPPPPSGCKARRAPRPSAPSTARPRARRPQSRPLDFQPFFFRIQRYILRHHSRQPTSKNLSPPAPPAGAGFTAILPTGRRQCKASS
jgi:hypothetical protein